MFLDLDNLLGRFELLVWMHLKNQRLKNWIHHLIKT